jgi:S1-C subfamily serine protease
VRVGGRPIESVYDYVRALREQAPDSTWRMIVERGGERVTLSVGPVEAAP